MLAAITSLEYIDDTVEGYQDYEPSVFTKDCIATVWSLVNAVSVFYNWILLLLRRYIDLQQQSQKATIFRVCSRVLCPGLSAAP